MSTNFFMSLLFSVSNDCPGVITFANKLNLNVKKPSVWTQLQSDCCSTSGVNCNGTLRVISISWQRYSLDGVVDTTTLPSSLQTLDLPGNNLRGSIPLTWPEKLTYLDLSQNSFTGSLLSNWSSNLITVYLGNNQFSGNVTSNWPQSIQILALDSNSFTGIIPKDWPSSLLHIELQVNSFTGTIAVNWPSGLQYMDLSQNSFTGNVPLSWPLGLTVLCLGKNLFMGGISSMVLPSFLQKLGIDSNILGGHLPSFPGNIEEVYLSHNQFIGQLSLNRPIFFSIDYNWVTNVIISDTSRLSYCDLSNAPLLGNPNIASLTVCTKNNLYSPSLLPNTQTTLRTSLPPKTTTKITFVMSISSTQRTQSNSKTNSRVIPASPSASKLSFINPTVIASLTSTTKISSWVSLSNFMSPIFESSSGSDMFTQKTIKSTDDRIHTSYSVGDKIPQIVHAIELQRGIYSWFTAGFKLLIDILMLCVVLRRTPFKREIKKFMKKTTTYEQDELT